MQKRTFVSLVAAKTGLTKKDSEQTMDAIFETLSEILSQGEHLAVSQFGSFVPKKRAARTVRNPRTGEQMIMPPSTTVALKLSQNLKEKMNPNTERS